MFEFARADRERRRLVGELEQTPMAENRKG